MLNPQKTKTHRYEAGSCHLGDAGAPGGHGRCLWAGWPEDAQPVSGTRGSVGWKEWDRTLQFWREHGPVVSPVWNRASTRLRPLHTGGSIPQMGPQNCSQPTSSTSSALTPTARPLGAPGPNSGAFKVGKTSLFLTAVFSPQDGSSRAKSTWKPV